MSEKLGDVQSVKESGENVNANSESGWNELEELGKKGFSNSRDVPASSPHISPESRKKNILRAARDVHAAYKNRVSDKYNTAERRYIDEAREEIEEGRPHDEMFIAGPPSLRRKALRLFGDKIGIHPQKDQERRRHEAYAIALDEHFRELEEQAEQRRLSDEAENQRKQSLEKFTLERDMATGHYQAELEKQNQLEQQRVQEMVERELNAKLTKAEDLEIYSSVEGSGVTRSSIEYEGDKIPVFNLEGLPFSILSTTIDYRRDWWDREPEHIGVETSKANMNNPAGWLINREDAKVISEFNKGSPTRNLGNSISASYYGSDHHMKAYAPGDLIYGFDHVDPFSVYAISNADYRTPQFINEKSTDFRGTPSISWLEKAEQYSYNEIVLRRYSEKGFPKRPDYIVTRNSHISEASLRHAAFFGIPIVNIVESAYQQKDTNDPEDDS